MRVSTKNGLGMRIATEDSLRMRIATKYGLGMRIATKYGLRMRVPTKYSGEGGNGGEGHDDEGGEGKTHRLLHGNSPISGSLTWKLTTEKIAGTTVLRDYSPAAWG
jgi:hypothetical protein